MKKTKPPVTYETRYKHKLNMLEPGTVMLECIGVLLLGGLVARLFRLKLVSYIIWGIARAIFLVLLILLAVEAHQDNVLNSIAVQEHKDENFRE